MEVESLTSPASRRDLRKQDRRQAIVDAARLSFLEHGYAATSMSGLLKTLGGSKATLWGYFRSKEELFAAVIEDLTAAFRAELDGVLKGTDELEQALIGFCRSFGRKITTPEAVATWRLVMAESGRFPEVGRIFYDRSARYTHDALTRFFTQHIAAGRLRPEDPARMADMLTSLCAARQTRLLWGLTPTQTASQDEDALLYTRTFLHAYAVRPDAEMRP